MTRTPPLLAAAAAAAALAASGAGCSAGCVAPPDWPATLDFGLRFPDQSVDFQRFSVDSSGKILWTGFPIRPTPIRLADLRGILAAAAKSNPEPFLVLDSPPDSDCATLRAVRAEMDEHPLCRRGRCVDGKVWDASDPPRGF